MRRPWAAVWVSSATGMINMELAESDVADPDVALQVLADLGLKYARCRPSRLEMTDAALGARLVEALGDPGLRRDRAPEPAGGRPRLARGATLDGGGRSRPARRARRPRRDGGAHACFCRRRARVLRSRTVAAPERPGSHPGGGAGRRRWSPIRQRARRRPRDVRPGVLSQPRRVRGSAGGRRPRGPAHHTGQVERDLWPARPAPLRRRRPVARPRPRRRGSHGVPARGLVRSRRAAGRPPTLGSWRTSKPSCAP